MADPRLSRSQSEKSLPSPPNIPLSRSGQLPAIPRISSSPQPSRRKRTNVGSTNNSLPRSMRSSRSTPQLSPNNNGKAKVRSNATSARPRTSMDASTSRSMESFGRPSSTQLQNTSRRPSQIKLRKMATLNHNLIPTEKSWATETRSKLGPGEWTESDKLLDSTVLKHHLAAKARNEHMVNKARIQLDRIAREKYGSIRGLFRMFDENQDGTISLHEFSSGLKKRNLEKVFPREKQRLVFDHIDSSGDNIVQMSEFVQFFEGMNDELKAAENLSPSESVRKDVDLERMRDLLKEKLVNQKRTLKLDDGYAENTEYLINAFHQIDKDQSGYIYFDEFIEGLGPGPGALNLGLGRRELERLFESMDFTRDGRISYYEFTKSLQMTDPDAHFDPFLDQKQAAAKLLTMKANAPWPYDKSTAEANREYQEFLGVGPPPPGGLGPPEEEEEERDTFTALTATAQLDARAINIPSVHASGMQQTVGQTAIRPAHATGQGVFDEMASTQELAMTRITKRVMAPPPTDWSRTGLGGNGTLRGTALFADDHERFSTTNGAMFARLNYAPNQPVTRDTLSDTDRLAAFRTTKFDTIGRRQAAHVERILRGAAMEKELQEMRAHERMVNKARTRAKYEAFAYAESQAVLKAALSGEYDARARFLERAARAKAAGASAPSLRSIAAGGMGSAEAEDPQGAQFFDNQGVAALKEMYGKTEGDGARQEARRRREAHRAAHQRREVEYLASARGPRARYELGKARGALLREKKQLLTSLHGLVAEEERLLRALPPPSTGGSSRLTYSTWRSTTRSAAPGGGGGGGGGRPGTGGSRATTVRSSVSRGQYYSCAFDLPKGRDVPRPGKVPPLRGLRR